MMPALAAIPWLLPLITGVSAAGTLAETGYQLSQGGGTSSSDQAKQQAALAAQQKAALAAQQKTAFLAAQPQVQANTGGSLATGAFNTASATQAGVPSDLNSIAKYLAQGGGGSGSSGTITPGILAGGTTAQNPQQQQPPGIDLQSLSDLLKAA